MLEPIKAKHASLSGSLPENTATPPVEGNDVVAEAISLRPKESPIGVRVPRYASSPIEIRLAKCTRIWGRRLSFSSLRSIKGVASDA